MKKIDFIMVAVVIGLLFSHAVWTQAMDMFPQGKSVDVIIVTPEPESIYRIEYVHDFTDGSYLFCTVCESLTVVRQDMLKSHAEEYHSELIEGEG